MKKIITCIIIAILLLNVGIYVFADETSNGQQTISVELKMSQEIKNEEERKKVVVKIGYGELQGIDNGKLLAFKGIVTYDEQYFEQLTQDNVKALNGHSVTYDSKEKRLLVESTRTPKSNEEAVEITFYLKEEIKNVTTSIEFKTEEFTDSENDFELKTLRTNLSIRFQDNNTTSTTEPTTSTNDKTTTTKTESTTSPTTNVTNTTTTTQTTQTTNTTNTTTDTTIKDELEILTTNTTTKQTQNSTNTTQDTTKTEEKELPKTGLQTVAIILIVVTAVSTVSYLKYKNIEIK